jgi:Histidine kinase
MRKQLRRVSLALALVWPVVAVVSHYAGTLFMRLDGIESPTPRLRWSLTAWTTLSLFTPAIARMVQRFPLRRGRILRTLLTHVLLCAAVSIGHLALSLAIRVPIEPPTEAGLMRIVASFGKYAPLIYGAIAAAVYLMHRDRQVRLSRLVRARMERGVATARLQGTIIAIDPSRVLRWLDDIAAIIDRNSQQAMNEILRLSSDLRSKLRHRIDAAAVVQLPAPVEPIPPHRMTAAIASLYPVYALYGTAIGMGYDRILPGSYLGPEMLQAFVGYSISGALWPLIDRASPRVGEGRRAMRNILIVGLLCIAHAVAAEVCMAALRGWFGVDFPAGRIFGPVLLLSFVGANLLQGTFHGERNARERMRLQNVARDRAEARLQALQTQLAPHFLFNALNSVLSLLQSDVAAAKRMLTGLRNVLYLSISHQSREHVALREDLELTMGYLDIQKIRFRDALEIDVHVDPSLEEACVPSFLLQPLVENAVRHGALAAHGRSRIVLSVQRAPAGMEIRVENDCELLETKTWQEGIGLSNIRSRLEHLYGSAHRFEVSAAQERGFCVRILLRSNGAA